MNVIWTRFLLIFLTNLTHHHRKKRTCQCHPHLLWRLHLYQFRCTFDERQTLGSLFSICKVMREEKRREEVGVEVVHGRKVLILWAINSWLGPTSVKPTHLRIIEFDVHGLIYIWFKKKKQSCICFWLNGVGTWERLVTYQPNQMVTTH